MPANRIALITRLVLICIVVLIPWNAFTQDQNNAFRIDSEVHAQWKFNHLTVDDGLSNNFVHSICQDKYGYIWIATSYGLNRFNGLNTKKYYHNPNDSSSLSSNYISSVFMDSDSNLWIGTSNNLHKYSYENDNFELVHFNDGIAQREIFYITEDLQQKLLIGSIKGLYQIDVKENTVEKIDLINLGVPNDSVNCLSVDSKNNIWLSTYESGVYYYNRSANEITAYRHNKDDSKSLPSNYIFNIFIDSKENVWLSNYHNGFSKFNPQNNSFDNYLVQKDHEFTKRVRTIFEDHSGRIFIGTRQGLFLFDEKTETCKIYAHEDHYTSKLSQNSITYSFIDNQQNVWLGTHSGGVSYFNMLQKKFTHYNSIKNNNYFLNASPVHCFDKNENKLYVGTENGINILDLKTGKFKYLTNQPNNNRSLSYNDVKSIAIESGNRIWVATNLGGVNLINGNNEVLKVYKHVPGDSTSLPTNKTYNVFIDSHGIVWVTSNTDWDRNQTILSRLVNKKGQFKHYRQKFFMGLHETAEGKLLVGGYHGFFEYDRENDKFIEFRNDSVVYRTDVLYEDFNKNIWIGSFNGLALYSPQKGIIEGMNDKLGLGNSDVYGILGHNNDLWVSTNNGLFQIKNFSEPGKTKTLSYNQSDGLQSREFNYNAFYKDSDDKLYFGGDNGFNVFHPDSIKTNTYPPRVLFSSLQIEGKQFSPGDSLNKSPILIKSISETNTIVIPPKVNSFTLFIDVIHYANALANSYKYKLNDEEWVYANASNNYLTFRNLKQGAYHLEVYGINPDGVESQEKASINIKILPPFWNSLLFKILVAILVILITSLIIIIRTRNLSIQKRTLTKLVDEKTQALTKSNKVLKEQNNEIISQNEEIQQQRDTISLNNQKLEEYANNLEQKVYERTIDLENAKEKAEESDRLKTAFLDNMSHEVRTPLNAIIGFIDILNDDPDNPSKSEFFEIIKSNGYSLMHIIEDIIDLSKIESGALELNPEPTNLELFFKNLHTEYANSIKKNNKDYNQQVILTEKHEQNISGLEIITDTNRFKQIFDNLISNAIKFTHNGEISYGLKEISASKLSFYVRDTGIGISEEDKENIFHHFKKLEYKTEKLYRGGGVGLSISRHLAEHLGGTIKLESTKNIGSTFTFSISYKLKNDVGVAANKTENSYNNIIPDWYDKTILIVEDEPDNYQLLKTMLKQTKINILYAQNGTTAISTFMDNSESIDLILMDIKLPHMSGYEVSEKIKTINNKVPIIAQTAYTPTNGFKNSQNNFINDYIFKPIKKPLLFEKMQQWFT